ncbi:uncharacterized protein [Montipora capricornis]|uniref:uncharacterized protein n=1 Tax=Montipora foliosa TaxID=591990 RepID=UPI0035F1516A
MSQYTAEYVHEKLKKELDPIHLEVVDFSDGCGAKFSVVIVSDKFEGKPLLAQHRMVNDCLVEEMKTIHALTIKTMKPAQWEKQNAT